MNPIDDLIKLISANPNIKDEDLYKSFPQLKGSADLTKRARAYAIGKSSGDYDPGDLDKAFPDVLRVFTPPSKEEHIFPFPKPSPEQPSLPKAEQPHIEDENDPLGNMLHPIQDRFAQLSDQKRALYQKFATDNLVPHNTESLLDINAQQTLLLNQQKKIQQEFQNNPPPPPDQTKEALNHLVRQTQPDAPDVDGLSIQQIQQYLPLNKAGKKNETAQYLLNNYENNRNVSDAVKNAPTIQQAALNYSFSTDPELYKQFKGVGEDAAKMPPAAMGEALSRFLSNPAAKQWAQQDPQNKQAYDHAYDNLFQANPSYGKKMIAQELGNAREQAGMNNAIVTILDDSKDPNTVTKNDELFNQLIQSGQLPKSAVPLYQQMRGNIKDYVPTPGLINNILEGTRTGLGNVEQFFKDWFRSGNEATYDALENQYGKASFKPLGTLHDITTNAGDFTGQMVPLMLISRGLTSVGVAPGLANATAVGLTFEHPNRQKAALLYPGDTQTQQIYTAASTGVDMLIGSLYNRSKMLDVVEKELKPEIASVVRNFRDGTINDAAAKDLVEQKVTDFISKAKDFGLETLKHNTEQSAQMMGFSLVHSMLDSAFGQDVSVGQATDDAVKQGVTAFLYGGLLSAMAAHGSSNTSKIASSQIYDIVSHPDAYRDAINRDYSISEGQRAEKLQTLDDGVSIKEDLDNFTELTDKQKQKVVLHELNQKILERQLQDVISNSIKDGLKQQIKDSKEVVQKIMETRASQLDAVTDRTKERINEINETQNAIQEQGTNGADVQPTPGHSETLGGGNEEKAPVNEGAPQESQVQEVNNFAPDSKYSQEQVDKALSEAVPEEAKGSKVTARVFDSETGKEVDKDFEAGKAFRTLKSQFRVLDKIINNCL